ncbi:26S proteasome regulatory subunit RPN6 [Cucumispora dikerogammari]|nr:26S proteasome regulatory subunit RPN6 [Cucumispora dikerogammari]
MPQLPKNIQSCTSEDERELLLYKYLQQNPSTLYGILTSLSTNWKTITTPRHIKIIKTSLRHLPSTEDTLALLEKIIDWSDINNKKNLKLELISFKINTLYSLKRYTDTIENIDDLIVEYKKLDERRKLADLYILKSQSLYEMGSFQKSRSILSSARGISLSTICSNRVVAMIDLISGVFLCDDGDYNGASSYFMEAVTGFKKHFTLLETTFSYIILSKVILYDFSGVQRVINSKDFRLILEDNRNEKIDILIELAECVKSVQLETYKNLANHLRNKFNDLFLEKHLNVLYNKLFDKAIRKLIRPYEVVYLKFVCENLNISVENASEKLHEMIVNNEITGALDVERGLLRIFKPKVGVIDYKEEYALIDQIK